MAKPPTTEEILSELDLNDPYDGLESIAAHAQEEFDESKWEFEPASSTIPCREM